MYSFHAQALNLARRDSIRNEPDLLQERFCDVVQDVDSFSEITEKYCFSVLKYGLALPEECQRFREVRTNVQRRQSNQEDENAKAAAYIAFQGMNAHETLEAIRAREHGMPHQAKVQRRMTNPQKSQSTWF